MMEFFTGLAIGGLVGIPVGAFILLMIGLYIARNDDKSQDNKNE